MHRKSACCVWRYGTDNEWPCICQIIIAYICAVIDDPALRNFPLNIGNLMDIEHAVKASEWLCASAVIPMHYNTFEAINIDILEFEREVRALGKIPLVLQVGQKVDG